MDTETLKSATQSALKTTATYGKDAAKHWLISGVGYMAFLMLLVIPGIVPISMTSVSDALLLLVGFPLFMGLFPPAVAVVTRVFGLTADSIRTLLVINVVGTLVFAVFLRMSVFNFGFPGIWMAFYYGLFPVVAGGFATLAAWIVVGTKAALDESDGDSDDVSVA